METSVPELNFSWSEFAEAGLFLSAQPDKNEACGTETSALSLNAPANSSFAEQNTSTQDRIAGQADSANSSELHTFEYGPRRLDLRTLLPGVARTHSLSQSQQSEHKQRHNASQKKQAANNSRVKEAIESHDRKLAKNREYQRVFKTRQKVRALFVPAHHLLLFQASPKQTGVHLHVINYFCA